MQHRSNRPPGRRVVPVRTQGGGIAVVFVAKKSLPLYYYRRRSNFLKRSRTEKNQEIKSASTAALKSRVSVII